MLDFTTSSYKRLLEAFVNQHYSCLEYEKYCILKSLDQLPNKYCILRHDIDKKPINALKIAELEYDLKITSTYYFRITKSSFSSEILKHIVKMGHEIGYHYEDYNINKGYFVEAKLSFEKHLNTLRQFYPIKTVSMHGNPHAKYDEGLLWDKLDTTKLGLLGEPYHSIDFDTVFYLTDTGRRWDGYKVSIWDKVPQQEYWDKQDLIFHSTQDIIQSLRENRFPNRVMITTHPQRWTNSYSAWIKELIVQSLKNIIKRGIIKLKSTSSKD